MNEFDHKCVRRECIYLGQRTSANMCRCHKTREQMLAEEVARLRSLRDDFDETRDKITAQREGLMRKLSLRTVDLLNALLHTREMIRGEPVEHAVIDAHSMTSLGSMIDAIIAPTDAIEPARISDKLEAPND
jgi:hypothetical protein